MKEPERNRKNPFCCGAGGGLLFEEFLLECLHHRKRTAHVNMMPADISARILHDLIHAQRAVCGRKADVNLQTRILFCGGFDLVHKNGFLAVADGVVEIHIVYQVSFHITDEGKEGCHADSARDPNLFLPTRLVIEHPIGTLDNRVCARLQVAEQVTGKVPAGFDRDSQNILARSAGNGEGMRFVQ